MARTKQHAFTLTELLVVLSIIALLMTLLLPSLSSARSAARSTACLSNLRLLAQTFHLYAADNRGQTPSDDLAIVWDTLFQPYVPNHQVFVCPADEDAVGDLYAVSYGWRESFQVASPDASLSGCSLSAAARTDLLLVFDAVAERHQPSRLNAATVASSAGSYTVDEFEDNLNLSAR